MGKARGRAGEVLSQMRYPDAPALQALVRHDYDGFARQLLRERKQAGLPPFAYQALLTAEHKEMVRALEFLSAARSAGQALAAELGAPVFLHDPVPMTMVRLANRERAQLLVESGSRAALQKLLTAWTEGFAEIGKTVKGCGGSWRLIRCGFEDLRAGGPPPFRSLPGPTHFSLLTFFGQDQRK